MKISSILSVLALGSLTISVPAIAKDCAYPEMIDVPDGGSATEDEMLAGQKRVKKYIAAMEDYLNCLQEDLQERAAGMNEEEIAEQRALTDSRHNAAVDDMEAVANEFNAAVRAYKANN